jgi:hypothetical protein
MAELHVNYVVSLTEFEMFYGLPERACYAGLAIAFGW